MTCASIFTCAVGKERGEEGREGRGEEDGEIHEESLSPQLRGTMLGELGHGLGQLGHIIFGRGRGIRVKARKGVDGMDVRVLDGGMIGSKGKGADKGTLAEEVGEPDGIIGPHGMEGDLTGGEPLRDHFLGLCGFTEDLGTTKEDDLHAIGDTLGVLETKPEDTGANHVQTLDTSLFHEFALCSRLKGFTWLDLAAKAIPLSLTKASLLHT